MIELLVTIGIILVLVALLMPALGLLRRRAAVASAQQAIQQLAQCLESYRNADGGGRRYPPPQSDQCIANQPPSVGSSAVLLLLESIKADLPRTGPGDAQGRLLDPWGRPYRYALARPAVSDPASLEDWNWDAANGRERAWGRRWDAGAGAIAEGALPFPYVWSLGPDGVAAIGAGWVYAKDAR